MVEEKNFTFQKKNELWKYGRWEVMIHGIRSVTVMKVEETELGEEEEGNR